MALRMTSIAIYQTSVMVYYFANQDYIIKELCVQKDNQQGCNGKCYLMKKMDDTTITQNLESPKNIEKNTETLLNFDLPKETLSSLKTILILQNLRISNAYTYSIKTSFQKIETPPPQLIELI